jgi:hypothetical protein
MFVSAVYADESALLLGATKAAGEPRLVRAMDHRGAEHWLYENCQQGEWLDFLAEGNQIGEMVATAKPGVEEEDG